MATYLITLSLGPVQSLIEAARRTRDLWCGSWLLSEAAKAAALSLHRAQGGCLVFPYAAAPDKELAPVDDPRDMANIANIIRARIEAETPDEVAQLCRQAQNIAAKRLAALCSTARSRVPRLPLHDDLWDKQVVDILESYAAWTTLKDGEEYGDASKRLGGLLAARKATRDFAPAAKGPDERPSYSIPKSSLDAARESVINVPRAERDDPKSRHRTAFRKLGLAGREELDALALAKRLAGAPDQFTAYSRVAADTWIETLTPEQQREIARLYESLVPPDNDLATRVRGNGGIYSALSYDAQLVYDFRLDNALARPDLTVDEHEHLRALQRGLQQLRHQQNKEGKPVGAPVPYAVILKADGDRMGKLLSQAKEEQDSRGISQALHGFASSVPEIIRTKRGHAIYSGGDDVLALLPLQNAVDAARALSDAFKQAMSGVAEDLGLAEEARPTLSVGLGIGHLMEPLGALRARADEAERAAKGNQLPEDRQRNALAIQLGIRSGAEYRWRAQWPDGTALADLMRLRDAYQNGELPSRVAYDVRAIADRLGPLDKWASPEEIKDQTRTETLRRMRQAEIQRMLARARIEGQTS